MMNCKKLTSLMLAVTLVMVFAGVSFAAEAKYNWKMAHTLAVDHPYQVSSLKFAELCAEYSGGAIKIEVFPAAQLGNERDQYESLQMGTLDIGLSTTSPLVNFDPSFNIFDMPFLFDDKPHAYRVLDGAFGQAKLDGLEKIGMKGLAFWECGLFNFTYNGKEFKLPEDVKGATIRTMESQVTMTWIAALGANPVPIPWSEAYTAIQNGTADGTILPITTTFYNKIYTVAKNYTMLNLTYSPLTLCMSKSVWDPLPQDIKDIVMKAALEARDFNREYTTSVEAEALETMKKEGTTITVVAPEQRKLWVDFIFAKAYPDLVPRLATQAEVDAIRALSTTK